MKHNRLFLLCLTFAVFSLCSLIAGQAKIEFSEEEFDFGFVPSDSKVSHVFWVKSVGTDTLKIFEIKPGCGCTQAPVKKKEISPGDSTELEIIYTSGRRMGESIKHPMLKVNTNPAEWRITIKSVALRDPESSYPAVIKPYRVYVSRAGEIEVDEGRFKIINVSQNKLGLKVVSQPKDYFDVDVPESIRPGDTAICKVKVESDKLGEEFFKSFTLEFNDAKNSRFTIPVVRRFIGVKPQSSTSQ